MAKRRDVRQRAPVSLNVRSLLRDLTANAHVAVDRAYSRFDLSTMVGYRHFLAAQAPAYLAAEEAVSIARPYPALEWPDRKRSDQLHLDLNDLGIVARQLPIAPISTEAELLGTAYVLEGSRLGGALLAKSVPPRAPIRFLTSQSASGAWRSLIMLLDRRLDDPSKVAAAAEAARATFRRFEQSALEELEAIGA